MISLAHNFLFVHIPKTAGNSIQNVLSAYSEDKIVCLTPNHDGIERFEVKSDKFNLYKHSPLQDYYKHGGETLKRLFKFASVRNPWGRMISFYFSPHRGSVSWNRAQFAQLITQIPPLTTHISLEAENKSKPNSFGNIDYFIRYESLNHDFKKVCGLIGIPWVLLSIRNKSKRRPYAVFYDDALIEVVRNRFSEEIAFFGYAFEKNT